MRGVLVMLGLVAVSGDARAEAEHYEEIRVDVGMTGARVPSYDGAGVGFIAEIKANVLDNVAVGGRVDLTVMFGGHLDDEDVPIGLSAAGLAKGEFLIGLAAVRPFVGMGAGLYSMASHTFLEEGGIRTTQGQYFGVAPEVGIDLGRVRLAATYNAVFRNKQDYLSFELSFRFGGGRKPPAP